MKNYKIIVFLIFFLSLILIKKVNSYTLPLINKTIYIDPGHGGIDSGANFKDIKESNLNLLYAKKIGSYIEKSGGNVIYTRIGDYDLSSTTLNRKKSDLTNRIKLINDSNADIYISIHMNSDVSDSWHGTQIFYDPVNKYNKVLANIMDKQFFKDNITKRKSKIIKDVYMYKRINKPGILIEVGFISNYSDRMKILDKKYQEKFSKITVKGLTEYFK